MKINHKVIASSLVITVATISGLFVFAQAPNIESLGKQYASLQNEAAQYKKSNLDAVNRACEVEQQIAKMKLVQHYNGTVSQANDRLDILSRKARGENLDCKVF